MRKELQDVLQKLEDCIKINKLKDDRGYVLGNQLGKKEKLVRTIFNTRDQIKNILETEKV